MSKGKAIALGIVVVIAAGAALVGLYMGGWWLKEDAVNRNSNINNDSYARQSSLADEIDDLHTQITDLDVTLAGDLTASQEEAVQTNRASLVSNLCTSYGQSTGTTTLSPAIHSFAAREC